MATWVSRRGCPRWWALTGGRDQAGRKRGPRAVTRARSGSVVASWRRRRSGERAAKLREHERVVSLVPVAEARPNEFTGGGPRGPFQDVVLAVEEVGGVAGVALDVRLESGEAVEWCVGPLPAVAHELVDAPRAGRTRRGTGRGRSPAAEVEVSVGRRGRVRRPREG